MNALNFRSVVAAVLLAGSLGAISAHAEGSDVGGSLGAPQLGDVANGVAAPGSEASSDEWPLPWDISATHVILDAAGDARHGQGPVQDIGPQYPLAPGLALGGELERDQPGSLAEKTHRDRYSFGVRISF